MHDLFGCHSMSVFAWLVFAALQALPEREKLLLDREGFEYPDDVHKRIANLSQSGISVLRAQFPCITPRGSYPACCWLAASAFEGIYVYT